MGQGKAFHGRSEGGLIYAAAAQGWRWMGMYVGMSVQKVELARPWLKRKCFWILAEVRADGSWAVGQNDTCSAPLIISRTRSYMDSSSSNLYKCKQCTKDSTTAARIGFQGTQPNVAYLRSTIVRIWLAVINIAEDLEPSLYSTGVADGTRPRAAGSVPPRYGRSGWTDDPGQTHANASHGHCCRRREAFSDLRGRGERRERSRRSSEIRQM